MDRVRPVRQAAARATGVLPDSTVAVSTSVRRRGVHPASPHGLTGHPTAMARAALADVEDRLRARSGRT